MQGFYSVYGEIFAKLAAEDVPYMDNDAEAMPIFGKAHAVHLALLYITDNNL